MSTIHRTYRDQMINDDHYLGSITPIGKAWDQMNPGLTLSVDTLREKTQKWYREDHGKNQLWWFPDDPCMKKCSIVV